MSRNEPSLEVKTIKHPLVYGSSVTQGSILLFFYHLPQNYLESLVKVSTPAQNLQGGGLAACMFNKHPGRVRGTLQPGVQKGTGDMNEEP